MSTMPKQKPGRSEQIVRTPPEFLQSVKRRLGIEEFAIDLAANAENSVAPIYYDEEANSLTQPWRNSGWAWCNPPYGREFGGLGAWTQKGMAAAFNEHSCVAMLVPAAVGSNWWNFNVDGSAYVTFLNGRITFVGHTTCYPKDLALLLYAPFLEGGSCVWNWKDLG